MSLVNDPVVAHAKLEETGKGPRQGFGLNRVKILGQPTELLQYTASHHLVEVFKALGPPTAELDLVHLPSQAPAARPCSCRNIFVLQPGPLEVSQKRVLNFIPTTLPRVGF